MLWFTHVFSVDSLIFIFLIIRTLDYPDYSGQSQKVRIIKVQLYYQSPFIKQAGNSLMNWKLTNALILLKKIFNSSLFKIKRETMIFCLNPYFIVIEGTRVETTFRVWGTIMLRHLLYMFLRTQKLRDLQELRFDVKQKKEKEYLFGTVQLRTMRTKIIIPVIRISPICMHITQLRLYSIRAYAWLVYVS